MSSRHIALSLLAFAIACENGANPVTPTAGLVSADPNPINALALTVTARVTDADSARVAYWEQGAAPSYTPWAPAATASVRLPVLGLKANTTYSVQVEVKSGSAVTVSSPGTGETGSLPAALSRVQFPVTGTAGPGYVLLPVSTLGSSGYAVAFDGTGAIAWYREFALIGNKRVDEPELQSNGHFTTYVGSTNGWQADSGVFYEYAPDGTDYRIWTVPTPSYTDEHEILLTDNGNTAHFFTYEIRHVDLSSYGGPADAVVAGHSLVRMSGAGTIEFNWNAWDKIPIDEWAPAGAGTDFDHPNSLALDRDGNYIMSLRSLSQVRKIDATTGATLWILGEKGQFTFLNDALGGPTKQHSVRVLPDGHLLMYDNGVDHPVQESRAVEYALDLQNMTATLVWEYRHSPAIFTNIVGYVQRLQSGNTLVAFGAAGVVNEVSPTGNRLWEGTLLVDGTPTLFYRARRIASLYGYHPA
jgi:hypothetical protein